MTNVPAEHGDRVGAVVVCDESAHAGRVARSGEAVLSAFKVPTVWLLLDSDDEVPRGSTGKVDVGRLREMLMPDTSWGR